MLDYVLFHQKPFEIFCDFLTNKGIKPETTIDGESFEIRIPDDLSDELADEIEDRYDELLMDNRSLMQEEHDGEADNLDIASVVCNLQDGSKSLAVVQPPILFKITNALSSDEFTEFVANIVTAVETPTYRNHCDLARDRGGKK